MKKKFSIIVPVYNVEKYLTKCLESLINQTYKNYEVIIVCDKCSDNSEKIVDNFVNLHSKFKKIYAEHTGLSKARNIGVKKAEGQYILFLDGDDYLNRDCLEKLDEELDSGLEVLRFQVQEVRGEIVTPYPEKPFDIMVGCDAFQYLIKYHFVENSWSYCYKTDFFKSNKFEFMEDCIAEDYGLTPLIIGKAKKVKSISYIGYNYVQRENSLMNNGDYTKKVKKMDDMLKQASFMKTQLDNISQNDSIIIFINNSLIYYSTTLKYGDYRRYYRILKKNNCFSHLKADNLKGKIRNFIIKVNPYIFHNFLVR